MRHEFELYFAPFLGGAESACIQRLRDIFVNSHGPTVHVRNFRRRHVFVRRVESEWPAEIDGYSTT
jgi:hypothetical protein